MERVKVFSKSIAVNDRTEETSDTIVWSSSTAIGEPGAELHVTASSSTSSQIFSISDHLAISDCNKAKRGESLPV